MLTTKGVFERKPVSIDAKDCVVEKIIRLSGAEYDMFANRLLADRDFIRENSKLMWVDTDDKAHCLLVTGEGRQDGILVNSEGSDYARYAALLPNVESFLNVERYPYLAELNKKLVEIADYIVDAAIEYRCDVSDGACSVVTPKSVSDRFGFDWRTDRELSNMVIEMLAGADGIADALFDGDDILVYWEAPVYALNEARDSAETLLQATGVNAAKDEIHALAEALDGFDDLLVERAQAILTSGLVTVSDVPALIDFLDEDNLYRFNIIAANDAAELGVYWLEENPDEAPEGISPEEYGRLCIENDKGVFTKLGYVYERECASTRDRSLSEPDELQAAVPVGLTPVTVQNGKYTSVVKTIERAKTAPKPPRNTKTTEKDRAADKQKNKSKGDDGI